MPQEAGYKTLAIRLDDTLHAQLTVLADLTESTITATIRQAIEDYVANAREHGDLAARAAGVVDEIERQANARKDAIAAMFGTEPQPADKGNKRSAKQ